MIYVEKVSSVIYEICENVDLLLRLMPRFRNAIVALLEERAKYKCSGLG